MNELDVLIIQIKVSTNSFELQSKLTKQKNTLSCSKALPFDCISQYFRPHTNPHWISRQKCQ